MVIALSMFQKALIAAALERYRTALNMECVSETEATLDLRLWIDRETGTVSFSETDGSICVVCNSVEDRDAVIKSLIRRGFHRKPEL